MLRTALLSTLAAAGLTTAAPAAQFGISVGVGPACAPAPVVVSCRNYEVEYRKCRAEPWRVYTCTPSRERAKEMAHHLRHERYEARIVRA